MTAAGSRSRMAALLFFMFWTWRGGRAELKAALAGMAVPISKVDSLLEGVQKVPGIGVYLASDPDVVPSALIRNIEHNHVVHETLIVLNMDFARTPRWDPAHRVSVETLQAGRVPDHRALRVHGDAGYR